MASLNRVRPRASGSAAGRVLSCGMQTWLQVAQVAGPGACQKASAAARAAGPPNCWNIASLRASAMCGEVLDSITLAACPGWRAMQRWATKPPKLWPSTIGLTMPSASHNRTTSSAKWSSVH